MEKIFGEPISVYTTQQALEDGLLIEAGPLASNLFRTPVLLTRAAWEDCVAWSQEDSQSTGAVEQSETGRLWDVLWMTYCSITGRRTEQVSLNRVPRSAAGAEACAEPATLHFEMARLDDGQPVLLLSLPGED